MAPHQFINSVALGSRNRPSPNQNPPHQPNRVALDVTLYVWVVGAVVIVVCMAQAVTYLILGELLLAIIINQITPLALKDLNKL